ncbi:MAG: hypothetical protein FWH05_09260 [Oscillospiraceae bacterium]|nr:hypothetical protein [Oscillospiraceae bacterium]
MTGREPKLDNDLFYVCALIEHIGRATKNRRADVVTGNYKPLSVNGIIFQK